MFNFCIILVTPSFKTKCQSAFIKLTKTLKQNKSQNCDVFKNKIRIETLRMKATNIAEVY